ncbi:MAG: type 2 isopentenyl-diphosphate Delta-isomerase, partial [Candidatus Bathyarchaeia archaeon]
SEEVKQRIYFILHQLKTVMFIVGAISIKKLKDSPLVITGRTAEWLEARGYDLKAYAKRRG